MKNITLYYPGRIKKVKAAVEKANEVLCTQAFYQQIRAYKQFDNSALSPDVISRLMENSGHKIIVEVNWIVPILKAKHDRITVSGWDFSSNVATGVNMLIYEAVNSIDKLYDILHNKTQSKNSINQSASWVIGTIAEIMVIK